MKRISIVAFVAIMLVSCSSKDSSLDEPSLLSRPLVVQSSLLHDEVTTKGAISSGDMGVFRLADAAKGYSALDNVKYSYGSPSWTTTSPIYLNGNNATLIAYYPYSDGNSNCTAIPMVSQVETSAADLCYTKSSSTVSAASPTVGFAMNHAYSKITVSLKNLGLKPISDITSMSIHNAAICKEGSLNITNGVYTRSIMSTVASPLSFNPGFASLPIYNSNDAATVVTTQVLLIPVSSLTNGTLDLSITIGGAIKTATVTMQDAKLEAEINYTIYATLDVSANISVDAVKCTDWVEVTNLPVIKPHR